MPSKLPIFAVRLTPDEHARIAAIRKAASVKTGLPLSQADVVRLALPLLDAAYPQMDADAPPKKSRKKSPTSG